MENQTKITISKLTDKNALHCQYQGQTSEQDCYIELDCRRAWLSAYYNAEIGNAVPFSAYHGHEQRFAIPCLTADVANALMEEIAPIAQRVVDGYEFDWDGNNHVAKFTDDAQAAIEEIAGICDAKIEDADEMDTVQAWDAADYWDAVTYQRDENGKQANADHAVTVKIQNIGTITAKTTDAEMAEMEKKMDAVADEDGVFCDGTDKYLEDLRKMCIDNTEEKL